MDIAIDALCGFAYTKRERRSYTDMALLSSSLYGFAASHIPNELTAGAFLRENTVFAFNMADPIRYQLAPFGKPVGVAMASGSRADAAVKTNTSSSPSTSFTIESILARDSRVSSADESPTHSGKSQSISDDPRQRFSWLQCTRYRPPKLPRMKRKEGPQKRKLGRNPRIPFSPGQVATLEEKFRAAHYLSSMDVAELSSALSLSETRVKIWFQNRRARERRGVAGDSAKSSQTSQMAARAVNAPQEEAGRNDGASTQHPKYGMAMEQKTRTETPVAAGRRASLDPVLTHTFETGSFPMLAPPDATTMAHFSLAVRHGSTSAFTPVRFPPYSCGSNT
ncbi:PREDICTED: homeobox protein Hox-B6-like [Priapulus caudatus]|uniref:Homeobox protein Hox-B6-like n=1 Tax=Priapulus caudatus TaxID=37621 RepID=A0ABM1DZA3_PRICU|nr:PREDICTED: homeobox protein Hox-B6-like [Priapulus caudatus]